VAVLLQAPGGRPSGEGWARCEEQREEIRRLLRRDVALEAILRRALGRAGIVRSWRHVCRRHGCGQVEERQEQTLRCCPQCRMKLWPKPVVRPIRFHDLRHTTATLLLRSGVPLVVVQKVLRHRDPKLTEAVYGHLATDYLRREVNRLKLQGMPEPPNLRAVAPRRVPRCPPPSEKRRRGRSRAEKPEQLRPLLPVGETGFEPATPWSRTKCSTRLSHSPMPTLPRVAREALRNRTGMWGSSRGESGPTPT